MHRRHLESVSAALYGRCFCIVRIQPQLSGKGVLGHSPKRILLPFVRTKGTPRRRAAQTLHPAKSTRRRQATTNLAPAGQAYSLCLCKRLRDAGRRDEMIALIFAVNPSVSLAADSLSLRLGHGAALICHWHIIHYRAATSLPLAQGSLWVCRQARRNLFSPITKKKQPFGCFFLVGPAGFGPAGCGSQSPVPYRLATAQSISQGIPEKGIPCAWGG